MHKIFFPNGTTYKKVQNLAKTSDFEFEVAGRCHLRIRRKKMIFYILFGETIANHEFLLFATDVPDFPICNWTDG